MRTRSLKRKKADDAHDHEEFVKEFAMKKIKLKQPSGGSHKEEFGTLGSVSSESGVSSGQTPSLAGQNHMVDEKVKLALRNLRKVHVAWDKEKRNFSSALARSQLCDQTKDTKVEKDLEKIAQECETLDKELLAIEQEYVVRGTLADGHITNCAKLVADMKKTMEQGKEKARGLEAWFKL